jgi:tRNA A-37 threonylcarbamoyl transferase component Bud32
MPPKRNSKKGGALGETCDTIKKIEKIMDISKLDRDGKFINPYVATCLQGKINLSYKYTGDNLQTFLNKHPEKTICFYIHGLLNIARGIEKLIDEGYIHNDINSDNILMIDTGLGEQRADGYQEQMLLTNLGEATKNFDNEKDVRDFGDVIKKILGTYKNNKNSENSVIYQKLNNVADIALEERKLENKFNPELDKFDVYQAMKQTGHSKIYFIVEELNVMNVRNEEKNKQNAKNTMNAMNAMNAMNVSSHSEKMPGGRSKTKSPTKKVTKPTKQPSKRVIANKPY